MIQPPQSLLRKAVKAGIKYKHSENLDPSQQESLRIKTQNLFKQVARAMKVKNDNESLIVWEQLNEHVSRQIENERRKSLGIEGY
jgi:hypothetical protein